MTRILVKDGYSSEDAATAAAVRKEVLSRTDRVTAAQVDAAILADWQDGISYADLLWRVRNGLARFLER